MAALTANLTTRRKEGSVLSYPCMVDIVYRGSFVCIDSTGYLQPLLNELSEVFAGVASEKVDNSAGAAGDKACQVYTEGVLYFVGTGFAQTDLGALVFGTDDQTVSLTPSNVCVGRLVEFVSSTEVGVNITGFASATSNLVYISGNLVPITAASTTYEMTLYVGIAGSDIFLTAGSYCVQVVPNYATSTLALENYDSSATTDDNLLSTATVDLEDDTAQTAVALTLTTTAADRVISSGDQIHATVAIGATEVAAGKGIGITLLGQKVF